MKLFNGILKTIYKSNGDRASPCFKTQLTRNMSDSCLSTRNLVSADTILLALLLACGYQTERNYYTKPPSTMNNKFSSSL